VGRYGDRGVLRNHGSQLDVTEKKRREKEGRLKENRGGGGWTWKINDRN